MKRSLQSVLASAAGLYNVMADNADVERLAVPAACGDEGPACKAQKTFMERTPIRQAFDFTTPKRKVSVGCTRAFVLVGDYACTLR